MTKETLERAKEIEKRLLHMQAIKKIVYEMPCYVDCSFVMSNKTYRMEGENKINIDIPFEHIYSREELKDRVLCCISELQKELDSL